MISIHLHLANPWHKEDFDNLFCFSGGISTHKAWEFEGYKHSYDFAEISINWKLRTDHAGLRICLALFGYGLVAHIYDTRHWNYTDNKYEDD